MADTISAATAWTPGDARLNFVVPTELPGLDAPNVGMAHIAGGAFGADSAPSLVVNFVTLTPDASGWSFDGNANDPAPPTVASGFATDTPDTDGAVIVGALAGN